MLLAHYWFMWLVFCEATLNTLLKGKSTRFQLLVNPKLPLDFFIIIIILNTVTTRQTANYTQGLICIINDPPFCGPEWMCLLAVPLQKKLFNSVHQILKFWKEISDVKVYTFTKHRHAGVFENKWGFIWETQKILYNQAIALRYFWSNY